MSYSILPVLHTAKDKQGLQKIMIRVIYNRMIAHHPTDFKIKSTCFNGEVTEHKEKKKMNLHLRSLVNDIEARMIDAINNRDNIDKARLAVLVSGEFTSTGLFSEFVANCVTRYTGKFSKGTVAHYGTVLAKVEAFRPCTLLSHIDLSFLQSFEAHLRSLKTEAGEPLLDGNTVQDNMKQLKGLLNKAADLSLIDLEQFVKYRVPKYIQKIPEYLTEKEIDDIFEFVSTCKRRGHQRAGYYFLLSCYAGYRIGDATGFNYNEMVKDGFVLIRAGKNNKIVSIPIYPKLQRVLDFVKGNPVDLKKPVINRYIKEIAADLEISKHIKFHTGRTSFAMMLVSKGFSLDEVAELLGDSVNIARIYGRITNEHLAGKVRERLG